MTPDGSLTIVHNFKDNTDGFAAYLTEFGGKFYGAGLNTGFGVVFAMSHTGQEQVLYQFKGGRDGGGPVSPPTAFNGSFYGLTGNWGDLACDPPLGCGTVYKLTPSGNGSYREAVLHRFAGGMDAMPVAEGPFAELDGTLYEETAWGGGGKGCGSFGCGAIFSVTPSGQYKVVYRFKSLNDGIPKALFALNGKLYGFAIAGSQHHCGTFFSLTPAGTVRTLYAFKGGADGCQPSGPVVVYNGNFYAVTNTTIFEVSPSGDEHALYETTNPKNGLEPDALTYLPGTKNLYGSMFLGGRNDCGKKYSGCGVIFELTL